MDDFLTFVEQKPKQLDGLKVEFYGLNCPDVSRFEHDRQIDFFKFVGEMTARSSHQVAISMHGFEADSFFHRFLKLFSDAKTHEIENLVKEIRFEKLHLSSEIVRTLEKERSFIRRRLQVNTMGDCLLETFELSRADAWTMTIAVHTNSDDDLDLQRMRYLRYIYATDCYVFVHEQGLSPDTLNRIMRSY